MENSQINIARLIHMQHMVIGLTSKMKNKIQFRPPDEYVNVILHHKYIKRIKKICCFLRPIMQI